MGPEMAGQASARLGRTVRVMAFDELDAATTKKPRKAVKKARRK